MDTFIEKAVRDYMVNFSSVQKSVRDIVDNAFRAGITTGIEIYRDNIECHVCKTEQSQDGAFVCGACLKLLEDV